MLNLSKDIIILLVEKDYWKKNYYEGMVNLNWLPKEWKVW